MLYWEKRTGFAGLQCDNVLDLIPWGETFLIKSLDLASSSHLADWKLFDTDGNDMILQCGLQPFHIFGGQKTALNYPIIPNTEQLPIFRFPFLMLKQSKISRFKCILL